MEGRARFRTPNRGVHSLIGRTDDLDLVRRCLAGAAGAWEDFVRRAKPAVRRGAATALRRFRPGDPETLDNVEQQVYVELLREGGRALRGFQGKSDLEGWVAIVAMRTAFRLLARERSAGPLPEVLPEASLPAPGESAERREFLDRLDGALRRLEAREREILRLAFFEQASYREIAERLGIPVNSVSPTLHRAKERLKEFFDFRYENGPAPPREG